MIRGPPSATLFPNATLSRSALTADARVDVRATHPDVHVSLFIPGVVTTDFARNAAGGPPAAPVAGARLKPQTPEEVAEILAGLDRKSTRLNSSHANISYSVF